MAVPYDIVSRALKDITVEEAEELLQKFPLTD